MRTPSFGGVLKAALVAGLAAGLLVAGFHFVATEPVIGRAITLEELRTGAAGAAEAPLVSREAQRAGLFLAYLLYGLTWALLFGATFHLVQAWLPGTSARWRGLALALLGYWSVGLIPFLKYPANPPGVGDPDTLTYRQALYFGALGLSVAGAVLAVACGSSLARHARIGRWSWLAALLVLGGFDAVMLLALPSNPDPIHMPAEIVANFRVLSVLGLTLFWIVLGLLFGLLLQWKLRRGGRPIPHASSASERTEPSELHLLRARR